MKHYGGLVKTSPPFNYQRTDMFKISLISRPKLNLLGIHYGVCLGNGNVIDIQQDGIKLIPITDFTRGFKTSIESSRWIGRNELLESLGEHKTFKYDLFENNCEHVSRKIVENKKISKQLIFFVIFAAIGLLLYMGSRK